MSAQINIEISGPKGAGKTTLAAVIAYVLSDLGYIATVPAEAFPIGLPDGAKLLKELKKL
jgi:pantothenate kinase-related protein Tda10